MFVFSSSFFALVLALFTLFPSLFFDLFSERELTNHSISIYRDLHCWELSLNWTPTGYGQGVNFKLNVKSPTLQDIKVEKKGGIYSGAGL